MAASHAPRAGGVLSADIAVPEHERELAFSSRIDVGASAGRALARGGCELMHQKGDRGRSQWAVLLDPNGAAFGIVPIVPPEAIPPIEGGASSDAVGRISWLDLTGRIRDSGLLPGGRGLVRAGGRGGGCRREVLGLRHVQVSAMRAG